MVIPSPALRITFLALIPATLLFLVADVVALARAETRRGWVPRWYNRWWVYAAWFVAVLLFPFSPLDWVRENVARAYTIPSLSMEPGILQGDYVMAAPLPAGPVARGTVVVYQGADGGDYVARVVGTPGDTLEMRGKTLLVNGRAVREPYVRHTDRQSDPASEEMAWQREFLARPDSAYAPTRDRWGPLVIPAGHHFLLGDNRDNAYDSRYWGLVPRERLVRRPVWIYFSLDRERRVARWSRIGEGIR
jgi:signal peptidase I